MVHKFDYLLSMKFITRLDFKNLRVMRHNEILIKLNKSNTIDIVHN